MITAFLIAVSEEQLQSNLRGDLLLVILGSSLRQLGLPPLLYSYPGGDRPSESSSGSVYSPAHTAYDCS